MQVTLRRRTGWNMFRE